MLTLIALVKIIYSIDSDNCVEYNMMIILVYTCECLSFVIVHIRWIYIHQEGLLLFFSYVGEANVER